MRKGRERRERETESQTQIEAGKRKTNYIYWKRLWKRGREKSIGRAEDNIQRKTKRTEKQKERNLEEKILKRGRKTKAAGRVCERKRADTKYLQGNGKHQKKMNDLNNLDKIQEK